MRLLGIFFQKINTIFSQAFHKRFLIYKIDSDDVL